MSLSLQCNNNAFNKRILLNHNPRTSPLNKEPILNKITQFTSSLSRNMETNIMLQQNKQAVHYCLLQPNYILATEPKYDLLPYFKRERNLLKQTSNNNSHKEESSERHERIKCKIDAVFKEIKMNKYNHNFFVNNSLMKTQLKFKQKFKLPKSKANKLIEINRILDKPLREPNEMASHAERSNYPKGSIDIDKEEQSLEIFSNEFNKNKVLNRENKKKMLLPHNNKHSRNKSQFDKTDKRALSLNNRATSESSNETKTYLQYKSYY